MNVLGYSDYPRHSERSPTTLTYPQESFMTQQLTSWCQPQQGTASTLFRHRHPYQIVVLLFPLPITFHIATLF